MLSPRCAPSDLRSVLVALLLLVLSAGAAGASARQATISAPASVSGANAPASCNPFTPFNPNNFTTPTTIDNPWLPLVPGTQLVLEGRANRGGGSLPHQVVFTVTDLTKVIAGVPSVVVWDRDFQEGQIVAAELAFFA